MSVALTVNLWSPSGSAEAVKGELQATNGSPSTRHRKLAPGSAEEKAKLGVVSLVAEPGTGPSVIERSAAASMVQARETVELSFPPRSVAFTRKTCGPSSRPEAVNGEPQSSKRPPSSRQLKLAPDSFAPKLNEGLGSSEVEPEAGPEWIATEGG